MSMVNEKYNANRINLLYQMLLNDKEQGQPREYDIKVDDLLADAFLSNNVKRFPRRHGDKQLREIPANEFAHRPVEMLRRRVHRFVFSQPRDDAA